MNNADLSDYTFHVRTDKAAPVIVIEDLNLGRMSVTNNIDAVVAAVCEDICLGAEAATIIYRDSDGVYDGVRAHDGALQFYALARSQRITDEDEAVAAVLREMAQV